MIKSYIAATGFLILFALCFYAKYSLKRTQPKLDNSSGLISFVIPLMEYYDSRSETGFSWQPMPRYVFEEREGGVWQFMAKFPNALEWVKADRLRFASMNFKNRSEAVWFANCSYVYFKNHPPVK
jgi:hypothetical protein